MPNCGSTDSWDVAQRINFDGVPLALDSTKGEEANATLTLGSLREMKFCQTIANAQSE